MQQTRTVPDEKSPVDQVLDLVVFAPLGLALTARTQLPEMVAKGRAQVEGQLTMARFIGQFAVQQGKVEVEKRLKAYTGRTPAPEPKPQPQPTAEAGASTVEQDGTTPPPAADEEPDTIVTVPVTVLSQPAPELVGPSKEPGGPAPSAADLAIPGYDALSASQVVQRLAGLSPAELEQVRRYEAATRGRKTVLTKISQLQ